MNPFEQKMFSYSVTIDVVDLDDDKEEQVSIYRAMVESDNELSEEQVIELAEENADWRVVSFGDGDWDQIDNYLVEKFTRQPGIPRRHSSLN